MSVRIFRTTYKQCLSPQYIKKTCCTCCVNLVFNNARNSYVVNFTENSLGYKVSSRATHSCQDPRGSNTFDLRKLGTLKITLTISNARKMFLVAPVSNVNGCFFLFFFLIKSQNASGEHVQ